MRTLFINACVRAESRTKRLADCLLACLGSEVEELRLEELVFPKADEAFLQKREALLAAERYEDPMFGPARQFAAAERIVIAAPYWDLSFPAALKQYFEQINALGITFRYTPEGTPLPLCRAERLYYVTTAGGTFVPHEYGFGYVEALARSFYGIGEVRLIEAAGLDIDGADPEGILREAMDRIRAAEAADKKEEPSMEHQLIAYCGVDCAPCPDYLQGKCPGCRESEWPDGDPCMPVACCRQRGIEVCGRCADFPCPAMREFYEESDSHREALERMRRLRGEDR